MYVHIIEMILAEILRSKKVRRTDIIIMRNQIFCLYHHHSKHNWLRHLVSFCWCGDCWNVYETFMSSLHAGSICRIYYCRGQDDCNELFKCPSSTSQKVDPIDQFFVSALIQFFFIIRSIQLLSNLENCWNTKNNPELNPFQMSEGKELLLTPQESLCKFHLNFSSLLTNPCGSYWYYR